MNYKIEKYGAHNPQKYLPEEAADVTIAVI